MPETQNGAANDPAADQAAAVVASGSNGRLLTAEDVAELLGVSVAWVYEQSRAGRIPTVTLGRYRRYRPGAISAWVEELEHPSGPPGPPGANTPRRAA
jgi:excisionase family DNA binding protein